MRVYIACGLTHVPRAEFSEYARFVHDLAATLVSRCDVAVKYALHDSDPQLAEKPAAERARLCYLWDRKMVESADVVVADQVSARIFTPAAAGPFPAVMYFHGGGWVLGDLDTHDTLCRRLANQSQFVVVSVDYRRAPEHKHPVPLDDCFAATRYVVNNAEKLQVDPQRLAVAGDSAGGNLAAAVALMARDQGGPKVSFQLLIYPVLQPNFETQSYLDCAEGFGLTRETMIWFWQQYLARESDGQQPYAAPLVADDLRGLPPAHVITAAGQHRRLDPCLAEQQLFLPGSSDRSR